MLNRALPTPAHPEVQKPIQRFEVVDCIDSKHVPAVIPNPSGPWVRYDDHAAQVAALATNPAPTETTDSLASRLIKACRGDALTWKDRKAIGEAIARIEAGFVVLGGFSDAGFLQENDYHLLHRFIETSEDDESYDIGKDAIRRLAELGVVQSHGFGRYSVTMFGHWVHERYWHQNPGLPLMTNSDRDRAKRAALEAKGGA